LFSRSLGAAARRVVTAASLTTSSDGNPREREVRAAVTTTKNVVIHTVIGSSTSDIDERDTGDSHTVGRVTSSATVQVVLLDIDTIVRDARHGDVLVDNVGNAASGIGVALNTAAVLAVNNLGVLEGHGVNDVVALSTDGADAETVTAGAVEVVDDDVGTTGDSDTVILVVDDSVLNSNVCALGDIETVAVVGGWVAVGGGVGSISGGVVQKEAGDGEVLGILDLEAVDGPVDDVEVGDLGVVDILNDNEVVGPV
jgi:hypothetical protein